MANTTIILCSVIRDDLDDHLRLSLEEGMKSCYTKHFNLTSGIKIIWIDIPHGQAYQGGKLSSTATILASVENQLPSTQRVSFIEDICQLWHQQTGKPKDQLVVSAADRERVEFMLGLSRERVAKLWRIPVMAKMMTRLLFSKVKRGYFSMDINLS